MRNLLTLLLACLGMASGAHAQSAPPKLNGEQLQQKCEAGDAVACDNLGIRYLKGDGLPKDVKKAATLFLRACEGGDAMGCYDMAESHVFGDGVAKDMKQAAAFYQRGCDGGHAESCAQLAIHYNDGRGVKQDDAKTALYADRSCTGGSPKGCTLLGAVYREGTVGYPKDLKRAEDLFAKACFSNADFSKAPDEVSKGACVALAKLTGGPACSVAMVGAATGERWRHCYDEQAGWRKEVLPKALSAAPALAAPPAPVANGAATRSAGALFSPANAAGAAAFDAKDYRTALVKFAEACDQGLAVACGSLGAMYLKGQGVTRSGARAAAPLATACDAGQNFACAYLAQIYDNGDGVNANKTVAFKLYNGACEKADMAACYGLGKLFESGQGTTANVAQAAALYQKACNGRIADSCSDLGNLYAKGIYFGKNEVKAESLYKVSCIIGSITGCKNHKDMLSARQRAVNEKISEVALKKDLAAHGESKIDWRSCLGTTTVETGKWCDGDDVDGVCYNGRFHYNIAEVNQNICGFTIKLTVKFYIRRVTEDILLNPREIIDFNPYDEIIKSTRIN